MSACGASMRIGCPAAPTVLICHEHSGAYCYDAQELIWWRADALVRRTPADSWIPLARDGLPPASYPQWRKDELARRARQS